MELYVSCFTYIISINLIARLQRVEKEICEALASKKATFQRILNVAVPIAQYQVEALPR